MMRFRLRPVLSVVVLLVIVGGTLWAFGVWAALCGVAAAATVFFASALAYTEFYGDAWTAIRYHWSILVGTTRGFHKIEDGATSLPRDARGACARAQVGYRGPVQRRGAGTRVQADGNSGAGGVSDAAF